MHTNLEDSTKTAALPPQTGHRDSDDIVSDIRAAHRQRRFAMKIQQKLDRALESFIRINATDWSPDMDEEDRDKINKQVKQLIKDVRAAKSTQFAEVVATSDAARLPADKLRKTNETKMEQLAARLPVAAWCDGVFGFGMLGLATIVAEAGDLSNYPNVGKLWKRLGYAPYDGLAGSTWKRESWRTRALTKEEWIANPFSGARYALIFQNATWLRNAQWIGKDKTEDGVGKPDGHYGEIYAARRARTKITHPDWSDGHADKDAIRIMMKQFLCDLWVAWTDISKPKQQADPTLKPRSVVPAERPANAQVKPIGALPGAPISKKRANDGLKPNPTVPASRPAKAVLKSTPPVPGAPIQKRRAKKAVKSTQNLPAARPAKRPLKSKGVVPGAPLSK